jgi:hypothetical protein
MLHIQESFAHNSSLLMAPMIPPTVPVQPQPSTSSRSIKVIEQLANRLEDVQREIVNTKIQVLQMSPFYFIYLYINQYKHFI